MDWNRIAVALIAVMIGFAFVMASTTISSGSNNDGPAYKVVKQDGNFEIRDYPAYIVAQVNETSNFNDAMYTGFMKLFNYISGKNTNKSKISMTAPVIQEHASTSEKIPMTAPLTSEKVNNTYTISFIMPAQYTLDTLPVPEDKNIAFKEIGTHRVAVIKFSGRMDEGIANKKIDELKEWLYKNNIHPKSGFLMAQYDPPWIPGFMRRNEVIVEI